VQRVRVSLGERSYNILIGPGTLAEIGDHCRRLGLGKRCVVITDRHVGPLYAKPVEHHLQQAGFACARLTIAAGETAKSLETARRCYDQLARHRLDRSCFIVALGGGVVGDLAGFVAATYLRGIAFVQVPTTLLAQVDSSVGGKVGVNLKAGKNLVGAFHQPRLVLCDLETLKSLPAREYRAGLAEVIKYGIIQDAALFQRLERELPLLLSPTEPRALARIVAQCCRIKARVVARDETEGGLRAVLNFGHTIGHAIENSAGYGTYLHGEAIAIGQAAAAYISHDVLGLPASHVERIQSLLQRADLPVTIQWDRGTMSRVLKALQMDKKAVSGEARFVLARRIGQVEWGVRVPMTLVQKALQNVGEQP